jgi:CubicO group peptidase (beta-lactamase class C family)
MRSCFFILLLVVSHSKAQDLIPVAPITSGLHQQNIGRILFSDKSVVKESMNGESFLETYTLTPKSDLFFTAFLSNSLTNVKHQLAPDLNADSLFKYGNYQFTIFIDGKEIYKSNLRPGAPLPAQQDTVTVLHRSLIDNVNGQGSWSESLWNRFMNNGGNRVLTDGPHRLKMEIRAYVDKGRLQTSEIMAVGELPIIVAMHPLIDVSKVELHRPQPYPGFTVSTAAYDTVMLKQLKGSIDTGLFKKITSIVVIRDGKILFEEYFNGAHRNTLHDTRSVGKSFASTLSGMAIADGFLPDELYTLGKVYPLAQFKNYSASKAATTLKDLLTMTSGFDGDDGDDASPGNEENMYPSDNWVKFALDLPFDSSYKKQWHYFTAGVVLLGDVLQQNVKGGLEAYASMRLFQPLGIQEYKWEYTPQGVPNTAGGLRLRALDLAKYGQLYQNQGQWKGKQLLPKAWIQNTFTPYHPLPGRPGEFYGYLFWNKTFSVQGKNYEINYCSGNGGNYVMIFKDQPLVVVVTATAYGQPYAHMQVHRIMVEYLIPALMQ